MNTPTKTTNRLHFEDLDLLRFEDLGAELLYRKETGNVLTTWENMRRDRFLVRN